MRKEFLKVLALTSIIPLCCSCGDLSADKFNEILSKHLSENALLVKNEESDIYQVDYSKVKQMSLDVSNKNVDYKYDVILNEDEGDEIKYNTEFTTELILSSKMDIDWQYFHFGVKQIDTFKYIKVDNKETHSYKNVYTKDTVYKAIKEQVNINSSEFECFNKLTIKSEGEKWDYISYEPMQEKSRSEYMKFVIPEEYEEIFIGKKERLILVDAFLNNIFDQTSPAEDMEFTGQINFYLQSPLYNFERIEQIHQDFFGYRKAKEIIEDYNNEDLKHDYKNLILKQNVDQTLVVRCNYVDSNYDDDEGVQKKEESKEINLNKGLLSFAQFYEQNSIKSDDNKFAIQSYKEQTIHDSLNVFFQFLTPNISDYTNIGEE